MQATDPLSLAVAAWCQTPAPGGTLHIDLVPWYGRWVPNVTAWTPPGPRPCTAAQMDEWMGHTTPERSAS